ncbi:ribonuclease inhibitor Barstar [Peribacillus asahii]|uniref:Ribonuclease inhibitor Barstar n=1 Tax=Peribacillus asahii TaxID=228899 RepID=A0A3T0KRI7_9BACI|nr:barstar family protein [Peribacillus asahii]AZV42996.1 ribonuclease inhibitor Barstar [Peribacillus asahii]
MEINSFNKLEKPFFHLSYNSYIFKKLYESTCENFENNSKKFVAMIDGQKCRNKKSFFKEFAKKLKFPDYFGDNWDAFDECLNDLEWLDAEQYVLFIENFNLIFENDEKNLEIFLNILVDTVGEWKMGREYGALQTPPIPFHIVMYSDKDIINDLQIKTHNEQINLF